MCFSEIIPCDDVHTSTIMHHCVIRSLLLSCDCLVAVGGRSIRDFRILSNRQQVLTKDSAGDVALWDVLHVSCVADTVEE